ncbi:MAG: hypothetical protein RQ756_00345 [Flavobacteriaceae bacterium]|nr:hypothetical protein [Flavobacteriaceae bacterium]
MSKKISIIGCGWLGFPLALFLKEKQFVVKGTTTTEAKLQRLSEYGIDSCLFDIVKPASEALSWLVKDTEAIVINIPPGKAGGDAFALNMQQFLSKLQQQFRGKLIFISSTSVFENTSDFPIYDEFSTPNATRGNGKHLATVEAFIERNFDKYCIIRPGGLWSEDRHPVYTLSGRNRITNPDAPVNMTHRESLIASIYQSFTRQDFPKIVHALDPIKETRSEYYTRTAKQRNIELPAFEPKTTDGKKIISTLNF